MMNSEFILAHESTLRMSFFIGIFCVVALWEVVSQKRPLTAPRWIRWYSNISIVFLNTFILRLIFPVLVVGFAAIAQQKGWGILNMVGLPGIVEFIIAIVLLDLIIYAQHAAFHRYRFLWIFHKMHHADLDLDVTSGSRFHTLEIIISIFIKYAAVFLIGPSPATVVVFEIILNGMAMFNHGNLHIPTSLDRFLRYMIVTPDFHGVHHSVIRAETNSNYGFNLSIWDRIFKTYNAQPEKGHDGMSIGLEIFREPKYLHLHWLLAIPFLRRKA